MTRRTAAVALLYLLVGTSGQAQEFFDLPPLPVAAEYGNILIDRLATKKGQQPVTFSHWSHRMRHTCRACHFELEFEMQVNATEMTEAENLKGKFCGACHDGQVAFGHTKENCQKCHNGNISAGKDDFARLTRFFPRARFGNEVDWVKAVTRGVINPKQSIRDKSYVPKQIDVAFELQAAWTGIPPAYFAHDVHNRWLDCANCHPDVFAIKRNVTKHFEMKYILDGKFCGACHLKVAFPLNDCKRCHPRMAD